MGGIMTEVLQIGLIVLIGIGHIKLILDAEQINDTLSTQGVPFYFYGKFISYMEI